MATTHSAEIDALISEDQNQSEPTFALRTRRLAVGVSVVAAIGLVLAVVGIKFGPIVIMDAKHIEDKYGPCPAPINSQGNAAPCYDKNTGKVTEYKGGTVWTNGQRVCFPGEATARVEGRGDVPLMHLQVGDRVLVAASVYEPLAGFIHAAPGQHTSLTVEHEHGELRVSGQHNIFIASGAGRVDKLASELEAGDVLFANHDGTPSSILSVTQVVGNTGMYAPLTAAGTIIVDGVAASNYANPPGVVFLPHGFMHASFFPARAYQYLGIAGLLQLSPAQKNQEDVHPLAALLSHALPVFAK